MRKQFLYAPIMALLLASACVSTQQFEQAEKARIACEARDAARLQELKAQQMEREQLVAQIAALNKNLGELEKTMADQEYQTQKLGETSNRKNDDIARLQADLGDRNARLAKMSGALQLVTDAQNERRKALSTVSDELKKKYAGKLNADISVVVDKDRVVLTMSDKSLFSGNIMNVPAAGIENLKPLAALFAEHPELDAEIVAYTDNQLPKNKQLSDTWDWSLYRATNITRALIKDLNVNGNQLTPAGRGEFYPVAGNNTAEGRARNRRTEIIIQVPMPTLPEFIQKP